MRPSCCLFPTSLGTSPELGNQPGIPKNHMLLLDFANRCTPDWHPQRPKAIAFGGGHPGFGWHCKGHKLNIAIVSGSVSRSTRYRVKKCPQIHLGCQSERFAKSSGAFRVERRYVLVKILHREPRDAAGPTDTARTESAGELEVGLFAL